MALFKNTYSGLITGGLGLPACCGLLTMGFHLFKCTIEVVPIPIPSGGVGGGPYVTTGFYVPFPKKLNQTTRMVLITIKIGENSWRRSYVVDRNKADIIVRSMNLVNVVKDKLHVGVNTIKRASKRVTTIFNRDNK